MSALNAGEPQWRNERNERNEHKQERNERNEHKLYEEIYNARN